jgi:hypothetical protein
MRSIATLKMVFPPIQKVNSSRILSFSNTRITWKYQILTIETFRLYKSTIYADKVDSVIMQSNEMMDFKFQERDQQITTCTVPMSSHITINIGLF